MEEKQGSVNSSTQVTTANSSVVESPVSASPVQQNSVTQNAEQPVASVQQKLDKIFSQVEVNKIVAGRVKDVKTKLLAKYGLDSETALDEMMGKAQSQSILQQQLEATKMELENLQSDKIMRLSKVRGDKFDEVRALLKGKNLPFTEKNLAEVIKQHPEWTRQPVKRAVQPLGNNGAQPKTQDEKDMVRKLFKSLK